MGKKSSSQPAVTKQEVTQSTLPEYARPYYENLMQRANTTLSDPYVRYQQERIAGFTPQQQAVQQEIGGLQAPGQFGKATQLAEQAGLGSIQAGKYNPNQFGFERVGGPALNYFQMAGPETFGGEQAAQYMSPFIQQALAPQMREAIFNAKRGQLAEDLGAARQGTYGGSRQLLASMERERNLGQNLGDIYGRGMQTAYEGAQQQFERDRAAQQGAQRANLEAALGVQGLGAQYGTQAALANQQAMLEAQRMGEQSRQFGADLGLRGYGQAANIAQTLGNIGQVQAQTDQARLSMQQQTAAQEQALRQQKLDTAYQDFLRQRDYPLEQLQQYSSLLRGVPVTPSSTTTSYAPTPGIGSQIMGTGLAALGAYKSFAG